MQGLGVPLKRGPPQARGGGAVVSIRISSRTGAVIARRNIIPYRKVADKTLSGAHRAVYYVV